METCPGVALRPTESNRADPSMNSFRYHHINALADEALELPETERAQFLDHACAGDAELREQVEQLIEAHSSEDDFLNAPVLEVLAQGHGRHAVIG